MVWHFILIVLPIFLVAGAVSPSENGYIVQVQIAGYDNPNNLASHTRSCCDVGHNFSIPTCDEVERCDNYFIYCLRTVRTNASIEDCDSQSEVLVSDINLNAAPIDFTQDTVLGLSNPFNLTGLSALWKGVQLYVTVLDHDDNGNPADSVETFAIDVVTPIGTSQMYTNILGVAEIANIDLNILVICRDFYYGDQCEFLNECQQDPMSCSESGECVDLTDGFMCDCHPGFNGSRCELRIDQCAGIDCSGNGICLDGVNSNRCDCNSGFVGDLCERIDHCLDVNCSKNGRCVLQNNNFSCICQPGFTGELCSTEEIPVEDNLIIIVGAVVGVFVVVILGVIVVLIVGILCRMKKKESLIQQSASTPNPDPVYETLDAVTEKNEMIDVRMNPVYTINKEMNSNDDFNIRSNRVYNMNEDNCSLEDIEMTSNEVYMRNDEQAQGSVFTMKPNVLYAENSMGSLQ